MRLGNVLPGAESGAAEGRRILPSKALVLLVLRAGSAKGCESMLELEPAEGKLRLYCARESRTLARSVR